MENHRTISDIFCNPCPCHRWCWMMLDASVMPDPLQCTVPWPSAIYTLFCSEFCYKRNPCTAGLCLESCRIWVTEKPKLANNWIIFEGAHHDALVCHRACYYSFNRDSRSIHWNSFPCSSVLHFFKSSNKTMNLDERSVRFELKWPIVIKPWYQIDAIANGTSC